MQINNSDTFEISDQEQESMFFFCSLKQLAKFRVNCSHPNR